MTSDKRRESIYLCYLLVSQLNPKEGKRDKKKQVYGQFKFIVSLLQLVTTSAFPFYYSQALYEELDDYKMGNKLAWVVFAETSPTSRLLKLEVFRRRTHYQRP